MPTVLENVDEISPRDSKVILIMGKTRTGKSTFINDVIGSVEMQTSDSLESVTSEISYVTTQLKHRGTNHNIALVDTVGWAGSDPNLSKDVLLSRIVAKLSSMQTKPTVVGIIYLHRITDNSMGLEQVDNLEIFQSLVGEDAMSSVIFLTNGWTSQRAGERAETALKQNYWNRAIAAGARAERLDVGSPRVDEEEMTDEHKGLYRSNALRIVRLILDSPAATRMTVQQEIEQSGADTTLDQLSAGKTLMKQNDRDYEVLKKAGLDPSKKKEQNDRLRGIKVRELVKFEARMQYAEDWGVYVCGDNAIGRFSGKILNAIGEMGADISGAGEEYPEMVEFAGMTTRMGTDFGEALSLGIPGLSSIGRFVGGTVGCYAGMGRNALRCGAIATGLATPTPPPQVKPTGRKSRQRRA
ncbi:hypothetical protein BD410DRAFT_440316 [Rickenella mellea]|uniref:G domain-containing protein n=1 Tax=Rickenella mellea TaxID=50990 RepID=A0A4Y7PWW3_9AGAM|nr:hypothetical protein BD410DRAFT_440316 [Rickenella mellea]